MKRISGLAFALTLITLAFVVPYAVFSYFEDSEYEVELNIEAVVSMAILTYCVLRLSWIAAVGRPKLLAMTFFLFIYVWVGLAATAQMLAGRFPWPSQHDLEQLLPSFLVVILAIAAYEAGQAWFRLRPASSTRRRLFSGLSPVISDRAAIWLSIIALVMTLYGMVRFGFGNLLVTRAAMDAAWSKLGSTSGGLISGTMLRTPTLVAFSVLVFNASRRWHSLGRQNKRLYIVLISVVAVVYFVANYPPAQSRFWLGAVVLTPAFALPRWRRWFAPTWIIAFAFVLTVAFPYLDMFRRAATISQAVDELNTNEPITQKMLEKGDYDVFQMTVTARQFVDEQGPQMGKNLLGAALFWFPRSIWSGKPVGTGYLVGKYSHFQFLNLSAPLWAEADVAFGWIGVVLLMLLYGRASAWAEALYESTLEANAPISMASFLVPYWAAFQMFIMRGDLLNATAFSAFGAVMVLVTARLSKERAVVAGGAAARPRSGLSVR